MLESVRQWMTTLLLLIIAIFMCGIFVMVSMTAMQQPESTVESNLIPANNPARLQTSATVVPSATAQAIIPTATRTLKPPPTFEPPTNTPLPTLTPTITPTHTVESSLSLQGLNGLPTATPIEATTECKPRTDWTLIHTVQRDDALSTIAQRYGTYVEEIVAANCLTDANLISIGQQLRVPGNAQSATTAAQQVVCNEGWEVVTPHENSFSVPGEGEVAFTWRGPQADRYLVRIYKPEGGTYEVVVDLRQNATVDMKNLPVAGKYTWYVYPLDQNFQQTACKEGGPWTFTKPGAPTPTPTTTATVQSLQVSFVADRQNGVAPLTVNFFDTSRGAITGYAWDFGDGSTSSAQNPTYTYATPGSYLVKLTVYNADGTSNFATTLIVVN